MFGAIRSILIQKPEFIVYEDAEEARGRIYGLAEELEQTTIALKETSRANAAGIAAIVIRMRDILGQNNVSLTHKEKIELTKVLNRAKVRTFMAGTDEGLKAFRILDAVSEDIRKYL